MAGAGGWGGEDLEEAEIHETFGAFQAESLLFHQVASKLLHKCAFIFFPQTLSRTTVDCILSGEA